MLMLTNKIPIEYIWPGVLAVMGDKGIEYTLSILPDWAIEFGMSDVEVGELIHKAKKRWEEWQRCMKKP